MKEYDLDTEFTFGKYEGKTVRKIFELECIYLNWCSINLDHFYLSEDVIEEIKIIKPNFSFSAEVKEKMEEKNVNWLLELKKKYFNDDLDTDDEIIEFW